MTTVIEKTSLGRFVEDAHRKYTAPFEPGAALTDRLIETSDCLVKALDIIRYIDRCFSDMSEKSRESSENYPFHVLFGRIDKECGRRMQRERIVG